MPLIGQRVKKSGSKTIEAANSRLQSKKAGRDDRI